MDDLDAALAAVDSVGAAHAQLYSRRAKLHSWSRPLTGARAGAAVAPAERLAVRGAASSCADTVSTFVCFFNMESQICVCVHK